MSDIVLSKLEEFTKLGGNINGRTGIDRWKARVTTYLKQLFGNELADEFSQVGDWEDNWEELESCLGFLEALSAKIQGGIPLGETQSSSVFSPPPATHVHGVPHRDKKVFVVHGHDAAAKEATARFLEKLGLDAIVLHEKPNMGQTVIEKFELFSDVGFAVVILTPDDEVYPKQKESEKKPRARQNVILELGYFVGKLGRRRVAALYSGGIEMPSDYQGVVYIELDSPGAWRTKLAQELVQAGMGINLSGLI